ncbi:MAG: 4a-hydroxytetrahydrobiopterin dehydratase [Candidatus Dactylopiibacterium sp.]|nr:4a-hydroxytetrahydrobiopterin dehydratase [Candidatus Dactylopiibacterium sp.]
MMRPALLDPPAARAALEALNRLRDVPWTLHHDALTKTFRFAGFREAFDFMTRAAEAAEALNHHPEWMNVYDRVEVRLTTHEVKGLTELDFRLAEALERAAA